MAGFGAFVGLVGCIVAAGFAIKHDFPVAGGVLLASCVCFAAERVLR